MRVPILPHRFWMVTVLLGLACTSSVTEPAISSPPASIALVGIVGAFRLTTLNDRPVPAVGTSFSYVTVDSAGLVVQENGAWSQIEFVHAPGVGTWAAYWGGFVNRNGNALSLVDSTRSLQHYTGTADDTSIVLVDRGANRWRYVRSANAPQPGSYISRRWARRRDSLTLNRQP